MIITILKGLYYAYFAGYAAFIGRDIYKNKEDLKKTSKSDKIKQSFIGFLVNFGDTIGIGAFGNIVALFGAMRVKVHDRLIPGTLNASCSLPTLLEAILFTSAIPVDPLTLVLMIASATIGSYIGAGIIAKMDEKKVQFVMGTALAIAATVMLITHPYLGLFNMENTAIGLSGIKLVVAVIGNFILGVLMCAGVGLYAPCMAMVSLLGMNIKSAFPIMMGSCAILMPTAGMKFIKEEAYDRSSGLFINLFGLLGVVAAYLGVQNANIDALKIIIILVIYYTAINMIRKSRSQKEEDSFIIDPEITQGVFDVN
ncbi:sulfite exporter TauE/SafE family protein [Anaerococcus sp. ENR0831]|uniref:Probable membrane transporter protein n=1 Tax=Anaerococcus martiniensis TaxID=3115615 RepID=A0ABW9M8T3_9FIRM